MQVCLLPTRQCPSDFTHEPVFHLSWFLPGNDEATLGESKDSNILFGEAMGQHHSFPKLGEVSGGRRGGSGYSQHTSAQPPSQIFSIQQCDVQSGSKCPTLIRADDGTERAEPRKDSGRGNRSGNDEETSWE